MLIQRRGEADKGAVPANSNAGMLSDCAALLLAGGDGTRLQDLTSEITGVPIPKQYCRLLCGASLLEAAIDRANLLLPPERIHAVINENHMDLARDQLKTLPPSNIFVQPLNRDTGPGIIFALLILERAFGDAMVVVFPTDHYIDKNREFTGHVVHAVNAISYLPDKVAILGIAPDRPEAGYGYILPANPLKMPGNLYHVSAFTEKPSVKDAAQIIARGGMWNTLVMVFRLSRMLKLVQQILPYEAKILMELRDSPYKVSELYRSMPSWNFSTRLLASIPQHLIAVKVANVFWSDWGTRESVERTYESLHLVPFWKLTKSAAGQDSGIRVGT